MRTSPARRSPTSPGGRVGLELELHLVDLAAPGPAARVDRDRAARRRSARDAGGQLRSRSSPADRSSCPRRPAPTSSRPWPRCGPTGRCCGTALAEAGYGAAPLGADLARPVQRVNPGAALRRDGGALRRAGLRGLRSGDDVGHRRAAGQPRRRPRRGLGAAAGTGARAGPDAGGASRPPRRTSAGEPPAGTRCARARWQGIDHGRSDPVLAWASRPTAWAFYALSAPVMLVRDGTTHGPGP